MPLPFRRNWKEATLPAAAKQDAVAFSTEYGSPLKRYFEVRTRSRDLAAPLSAEDQTVQSMPDASPTKWHLAHTTWFFETFLLEPFAPDYTRFDSSFGYLFNSYYDALGERHPRPERGMLTRPGVAEIAAYRAHVDRAVEQLLNGGDSDAWRRMGPVLDLGIAHEEQHQELILMDIKHLLSLNPLRPSYRPMKTAAASEAANETAAFDWVEMPGGVYAIGADGAAFAFDNERPRHKVYLEPFRLATRCVTNGEFLAFVEDGGYRRPEFWLSDGWAAVEARKWHAPLYWRDDDGAWSAFTLGGERPLNLSEPVCHVSYFEADAFARWAGKRLPLEAEWEVVAARETGSGHFAASNEFHPRPAAGIGAAQLYGDVWEWTSSAYAAYPRFAPADGALGEYNGKFMCGQFVLRGGSCATPDGHIRATYRNFFPPSARWAYSGIRLADDDA
jgi:ergothioneine biosynthesis protein EgtB